MKKETIEKRKRKKLENWKKVEELIKDFDNHLAQSKNLSDEVKEMGFNLVAHGEHLIEDVKEYYDNKTD